MRLLVGNKFKLYDYMYIKKDRYTLTTFIELHLVEDYADYIGQDIIVESENGAHVVGGFVRSQKYSQGLSILFCESIHGRLNTTYNPIIQRFSANLNASSVVKGISNSLGIKYTGTGEGLQNIEFSTVPNKALADNIKLFIHLSGNTIQSGYKNDMYINREYIKGPVLDTAKVYNREYIVNTDLSYDKVIIQSLITEGEYGSGPRVYVETYHVNLSKNECSRIAEIIWRKLKRRERVYKITLNDILDTGAVYTVVDKDINLEASMTIKSMEYVRSSEERKVNYEFEYFS